MIDIKLKKTQMQVINRMSTSLLHEILDEKKV
jgi:hypothetical protein